MKRRERLVSTHISEGPAVAGLAIGCFHRKPRRGGRVIGENANYTLPFCFSAPKAFGAEKQKERSRGASVAINRPPLRGFEPPERWPQPCDRWRFTLVSVKNPLRRCG